MKENQSGLWERARNVCIYIPYCKYIILLLLPLSFPSLVNCVHFSVKGRLYNKMFSKEHLALLAKVNPINN